MFFKAEFYTSLDPQAINCFSIVLRTVLAVVIGGSLGLDRGLKRHPAGLRTYILVCLGSTLVMMTNQYVFQTYDTGDIGRMGAQVISGIGFLGAGTIMITGRNQVKGLTTAAGLWAAACVGLALGIGFYFGAILGGVVILLVMTILHKFDERVRKNSRMFDLYLEFESPLCLGTFISSAKDNGLEISNVHITKDKSGGKKMASVLLTIKCPPNGSNHAEIMQALGCVPGLTCIEEV